jgi:hypothetical protein
MEDNWNKMTAKEKRETLVNQWLSPAGVEYASPEAEKE